MTSNLAHVEAIYAAWERGDYSVWWADPEMEYVAVDGPNRDGGKGASEFEAVLREVLSTWQQLQIVAEELRELPGGRVLALTRVIGRGNASGVDLEQERATVFELSDGRVSRYIAYWDRGRALADAGQEP